MTTTIPVEELLLDLKNPRYVASGQRQAMQGIIENQGSKLFGLAKHIAANGLSPIDPFLVLPKGDKYVVLEGNRRLAAVRLLSRPEDAGSEWETKYRELAEGAAIPKKIECSIAGSREEGRVWILLRHSGEAGGAGIVRWGAAERERFEPTPGSHAAQGLAFAAFVRSAFANDKTLLAKLDKIGATRITTLGRLVSDPRFKNLLKLTPSGDSFVSKLDADDLRPAVARVVSDFAATTTVRAVDTQAERGVYIATLEKLLGGPTTPAPPTAPGTPPVTGGPTTPTPSSPVRPPARRAREVPLLNAFDPQPFGKKTIDIVAELRTLNIDKFPNAAALMLRAVLELSVNRIYEKEIGEVGNTQFRKRVAACLRKIDASGKDPAFVGVRKGLNDVDSLQAVSTLHAFVHSSHYHPTAGAVRSIAANWEPFLIALAARV